QERVVTSALPGPLAVALGGHPPFTHSGIRAFVRQVGHDLRLQAQELAVPQRRDAETLARTFIETRSAREAAIVEVIAANQRRAPLHTRLFGRRTEDRDATARVG